MASLVHNPLHGIQEKLDRACHHLETLDHEIRSFLHSDACGFVCDVEPEGGYHYIRFKVDGLPPLLWSVILGDFLHNLRSALDYLIWQMVIAMGLKQPCGQNYFPIFDEARDWEEKITKPRSRGKKHPLWGLNDWAVAEIKALQPFQMDQQQGRFVSGLVLLRDLSNVDKHHLLNAHYMVMGDRPPAIDGDIDFDFMELRTGAFAIEDGTPVARVRPLESFEGEVNVQAYFAIDVRFGEREVPWKQLSRLLKSVQELVKYFASGIHFGLPPT